MLRLLTSVLETHKTSKHKIKLIIIHANGSSKQICSVVMMSRYANSIPLARQPYWKFVSRDLDIRFWLALFNLGISHENQMEPYLV